MKKFFKRSSSLFFAAILSSFPVIDSLAQSVRQSKDWEKEWESTSRAAKKDGKLVFHSGNSVEPYFQEFEKKFPEIKATRLLTHGGSAAHERLIAERRAGVYVADIVHLGAGSGSLLAAAGALDPLEPYMVLPEVLDQSKWFEGRHYFADKEGKYLLKYASNPGVDVSYNTKLVNSDSIKSYWDLLDAKWKGKIVAFDPRARGSRLFSYFYYNPELGPRYLKRLFSEMDLTASRDRRQMTDWLAAGKFPICFWCEDVEKANTQGLPVDMFGRMKEGAGLSAGQAILTLVNQAPHANAARVFVNWFLSRDGQLNFQKALGKADIGSPDSLRIDIPKDDVDPKSRRIDGVKYVDTEQWQSMKSILAVVEEALAQAGKK